MPPRSSSDVTTVTPVAGRRSRARRTGLPASGKSTIAVALERTLVESQRSAYLLDGDNLRYGLSDDLGFSPGDRAEHIRRVAHLARLIADAGTVAVVSLVSPMGADRTDARALHDAAGLRFVEVHVDTTADECARRDPRASTRAPARARSRASPASTRPTRRRTRRSSTCRRRTSRSTSLLRG